MIPTSPHVVVIDSTPTNRQILKTHLERIGYRVTTYERSVDALQALLRNRESLPDLLITELDMPQIAGRDQPDGLDIIQEVRKHTKTLPILVITARDGVIDRLKARLARADDYLTKPYRVEVVTQKVNALLVRNRP